MTAYQGQDLEGKKGFSVSENLKSKRREGEKNPKMGEDKCSYIMLLLFSCQLMLPDSGVTTLTVLPDFWRSSGAEDD